MPPITLEQALYVRPDHQQPRLVGRSPGFADAWLDDAEQLVLGFGARRNGLPCPLSVFARPLTKNHIAIVRVKDENADFPTAMRFHFLIVEQRSYEAWIRDPFILAEKIAPTWDTVDGMPGATIPEEAFRPRTVEQVQAVLKRVKASALKEDEDPEAPDFERTPENSESPALLGGVQILIDGGRLVFERPRGDLQLAAGMWLLLPERTRCRLWPASFAFSDELDFDLLIVPELEERMLADYRTEDQAAEYPDGNYEFALQHAAETGDQRELDAVFRKRDSRQTIRLALAVLVLVSVLVLISRWEPGAPRALPGREHKVAAAAGIVAVGDPWTALGMIVHGNSQWQGQEKNDAK